MTVRLGTRGSALAIAQSRRVADAIVASLGQPVELIEVTTVADHRPEPVARLGVGVFVSTLREALLSKEIDIAVHSFKDLPTAPAEGIALAAVPLREDPRDALVARAGVTLAELPSSARIGTGSPRRIAQLRGLAHRFSPVAVRGNVDTRLRMVTDGELDAVVVARAGLLRLGRESEATEILDPMVMLPAPAQGALAIECRENDLDLRGSLGRLDDPSSHATVVAERALLRALNAGCSAPVGALADLAEGEDGPELYLRGGVFSLNGSIAIRRSSTAPATERTLLAVAERAGRELAADLFANGAETVLGVHNDPQP